MGRGLAVARLNCCAAYSTSWGKKAMRQYARPSRNSSATCHTVFHYACSSLLPSRKFNKHGSKTLLSAKHGSPLCVDHAHKIELLWGGAESTRLHCQMQLSVKLLPMQLPLKRNPNFKLKFNNFIYAPALKWGVGGREGEEIPACQVLNERQHLGP